MLVDRMTLTVKGGNGGDGCLSFRREKYVPRGGPNGGDGGDGGNVILRASPSVSTLIKVSQKSHVRAENGRPGGSKKKTGRSGKDTVVMVPCGTLVFEEGTKNLLGDLVEVDEELIVAKGGKGGRGNTRFASSTDQVPYEFEQGEIVESRRIFLELKLIADVGLIGLPNAGKSTLISRISAARPKIASYPFTTLEPNLGIVDMGDHRSVVVADIPGLIEGAHEGHGLGHEFLRHVERTHLLVHLIDPAPMDGSDPVENYRLIRKELEQYDISLKDKPEIICASKMDLPDSKESLERLQEEIPGDLCPISSVSGEGVKILLETIWRELEEVKQNS